jgi:hypothetical protein
MHTLRFVAILALLLPTLLHATPRDSQYEVYVSSSYQVDSSRHGRHVSPDWPKKSEILERIYNRIEFILDRWRDRWGRHR